MHKVYVGDRGAGKTRSLMEKYGLYKSLGYKPKMVVASRDATTLYLKYGVDREDIVCVLDLFQDNGWIIKTHKDEKYILIFDDVLYTLARVFKCPLLMSVDSSDVFMITKKSASVVASYDSLVDRAKHGPINAKIFNNDWEDITIQYDDVIDEIYYKHSSQYVLITPQDKIYVE